MSQADSTKESPTHVAAVDLGSNSFHMIVVRIVHDDVQPLFKYKERVRLAEGLNEHRRLSNDAIERGVAVLKNFAEQLSPLESCKVRVIATHTLRHAKNRQHFLSEAAKVFPYNIEVVSGQEEARLIYLGVAEIEQLKGNTLVIDIGGGSTELAIGANAEMLLGRSHAMGCVSYTQRYFSEGVDKRSYGRAKIAAQQLIERFVTTFQATGWNQVRLTSGTAQAIMAATSALKCGDELTPDAIKTLKDLLISGETDHKAFKDISEERQSILAGGLAIMDAVFDSLGIEAARFSTGALREGVLREERVSELPSADTRTRSVQSLVARYHVDTEQAQRVQATALRLWDQVAGSWELKLFTRRYLSFAADVHEIGLNISASGSQKHSAYIVQNSNLPGFSFEQQLLVAAMVRQYRKRLKPELIPDLLLVPCKSILGLIRILRLAVIWHTNRHPEAPELPVVRVKGDALTLRMPSEYANLYPLLIADIEREIDFCAQNDITLKLDLDD